MNRLRARVFSAVAALAVALAVLPPASAQDSGNPNFWFAGTRLIFERAIPLDGDVAVSIKDSGLQRFLAKLGATVAYQPQQRYVVVTAADHRTITFTLGSAQYLAGGVSARATFAPFVDGTEPIVPLFALAHALYVEPVAGAGETILQPQIGALDIRTQGRPQRLVVIRGGDGAGLREARRHPDARRVRVFRGRLHSDRYPPPRRRHDRYDHDRRRAAQPVDDRGPRRSARFCIRVGDPGVAL